MEIPKERAITLQWSPLSQLLHTELLKSLMPSYKIWTENHESQIWGFTLPSTKVTSTGPVLPKWITIKWNESKRHTFSSNRQQTGQDYDPWEKRKTWVIPRFTPVLCLGAVSWPHHREVEPKQRMVSLTELRY